MSRAQTKTMDRNPRRQTRRTKLQALCGPSAPTDCSSAEGSSEANQHPRIALDQITYTYPGESQPALRSVDLCVQKGQIVLVTGHTGCGKSTLLGVMRGLTVEWGGKVTGSIRIDGEPLVEQSIMRRLGRRMGLILQNPAYQLHQLTVWDEVVSSPTYQGLPWNECVDMATTALAAVGMTDLRDRPVTELSGGQQQRAALAACLAMKCDILLLDEPFSYLDISGKRSLTQILVRLAHEGFTLVVAAHDTSWLLPHATALTVLQDGVMVAQGDPREILYKSNSNGVPRPLVADVARWLHQEGRLCKDEMPLDWEELRASPVTLHRPSENAKGSRTRDLGCVDKAANTEVLKLEGITAGYKRGAPVLQDAHLSIRQGVVHGLIGVNGSGKTTLIKVAMGLLKPSAGRVFFRGSDITGKKPGTRASFAGYVPQQPEDMIFAPTVYEEVRFGPRTLSRENPDQLATEAIKRFGLQAFVRRNPDDLSAGQKRLVSLAAVCSSDPALLLLDEPEFGLDRTEMMALATLARAWAASHGAVLVVSQDLEAVLSMCDSMTIMACGRILRSGSTLDILADRDTLLKSGLGIPPYADVIDLIWEWRRAVSPDCSEGTP